MPNRAKAGAVPAVIRLILGTAFVLGCLCAYVLVLTLGEGTQAEVRQYLQGSLSTIQGQSLLWVLWSVLRFPLLLWLFSRGRCAPVGLPLLLFLRGASLSLCLGTLVLSCGEAGWQFALWLLGGEALLSVPALFILGVHCWETRVELPQNRHKTKLTLRPYLLCFALLFLCICWEYALLPRLLLGLYPEGFLV